MTIFGTAIEGGVGAGGGGGGGGTGDVVGPASSTDNAVARFDSTTGKLLQNSVVTISDAGVVSTSGGPFVGNGEIRQPGASLDIYTTGVNDVRLTAGLAGSNLDIGGGLENIRIGQAPAQPISFTGVITHSAATLAAPWAVADGGTGAATLTNHGVLVGAGTSAVVATAAGTTGQPLVSGGASADPAYAVLGVVGGGTGAATLAAHGLLIGNGTGAVVVSGAGTSGQVLTSNGAAADPTFQAAAAGGANTALSNLASVAINLPLATGAGTAAALTATAPAAGANAQAGVSATITASPAVDGSSGHAAQAGGNVYLRPGATVNGGADGQVVIKNAAGTDRLWIGEVIGNRYGMMYPSGTALIAVSNDGGTTFIRTQSLEISDDSNARFLVISNPSIQCGLSTAIVGYSHNDPQQGSADSGLMRNAPAVWRSTDGSTGIGAFLTKRLVEANTAGSGAPNVLAVTESGTLLHNNGATAENYHSLPAATIGVEYHFYCADTDGIRVTANGSDTIRLAGSVSGAGGRITSTTIGSYTALICVAAATWVGYGTVGTWVIT
jgi:hypothetical protein